MSDRLRSHARHEMGMVGRVVVVGLMTAYFLEELGESQTVCEMFAKRNPPRKRLNLPRRLAAQTRAHARLPLLD